jgi:hypothetical protein
LSSSIFAKQKIINGSDCIFVRNVAYRGTFHISANHKNSGSLAPTMNTNESAAITAAPPKKRDTKFLGPCVIAALVWLVLSVYMFYVVPAQLEIREQVLKPEQLRAALPVPMRVAMFFHGVYGTTLISALGLLGCGVAYARRNAKMANWMIALGIVCLIGLIWAVLSNVAAR